MNYHRLESNDDAACNDGLPHNLGHSLPSRTRQQANSGRLAASPSRPSTPPFQAKPRAKVQDAHGQSATDPLLPWCNEARDKPAPTLPALRLRDAQLAMLAAGNAALAFNIKDELALAAGRVTPGVDDTPYIQYALEVLSRDTKRHSEQLWPHDSSRKAAYSLAETPATPSLEPPDIPGHAPRPSRGSRRGSATRLSLMDSETDPNRPLDASENPVSTKTPPRHTRPSKPEKWIPVDEPTLQTIDPRGKTYPPLTFKPCILRTFSIMCFMLSCLVMAAALVFSNRYSTHHAGLTPYPGSIYSGQYFAFRILPQLIASFILLFAQNIVTASLRTLPFTLMAREDPRDRYLALFARLYPQSFLCPQLVGPWQLRLFNLATWLAILTVPLQSAAFTCIYVQDRWIWAPSQGVMWALVALYLALLLSAAMLMGFWFRQWTGLRWDIRSIAHLIPLLNRTNTLRSYIPRGHFDPETKNTQAEMRSRWFDRLGYWQTEGLSTGGLWHGIGTSAMPPDHEPVLSREHAKRGSSHDSLGSEAFTPLDNHWGDYIPWCLRDAPLLSLAVVTSTLLLALLVVSFLPRTRLEAGFVPRLSAKPNQAAFSPANFVFSFVPSLIGMLLFLIFQKLDQSLRILQPWAELSKVDGASARCSILADYAACLPLQATLRALGNGHWRLAITSLMSDLFVFIPILAGGLFMALTAADDKVRMFPNMPVFGILLTFLLLYVVCVLMFVPRRHQLLLPHSVTSVAAIIGLCSADDFIRDSAFRAVRSRGDVEARLGVGRDDLCQESTWFFGLLPGKDEKRPSVRRMRRFTEKGVRSARAMV
ncbi:hypothetical protein CDD82_406 [Ophiocordyceps australis]|uniref:Phosphoribosylaminoimidazole-succinocarboxamide synthase n=1 Tax=Ophiocordyceps australis TaxID=1399860 RepID=A0A2C5YNX2_9HYPO|nr:hypothetical protein CDD82_406 [Ophiocordyceps australis]